MKRAHCLLISSVLLFQIALGESVVTPKVTTGSQEDGKVLSNHEVDAYLKAMVVQQFNIEKANLKDALNHLDKIIEPYGMQILFRPHKEEELKVNLKTRNLNMARNLSFLCRQVGYDWWVDDGVIIVGMMDSDEALVTEFIPVNSSTVRRVTYRNTD